MGYTDRVAMLGTRQLMTSVEIQKVALLLTPCGTLHLKARLVQHVHVDSEVNDASV